MLSCHLLLHHQVIFSSFHFQHFFENIFFLEPITAVMATCDLEDDNVSITTNLPSLESRPQTIPNEYTCEYMEQNVNASG